MDLLLYHKIWDSCKKVFENMKGQAEMMNGKSNVKLNILIAHNYYQIPGGEDSVVQNESKLLKEKGHSVFMYERSNTEINNINVLSKLLLPLITIFNIRTFNEIRKLIIEKKIDVIHVHNTLFFISPSIYYAAKSLGIPVVQTIHNFRLLCVCATFYRNGTICEECLTAGKFHALKYKCYRNSFFQTFICSLNNLIHTLIKTYKDINFICLTEFNKEKLLNLKHINPNRVYIKPNFISDNISVVESQCRRNQYVFAGRIDELKGVRILLQAWKLLQLKGITPELNICGTGPLSVWCENYIKNNHLTNVKMLGFLDNRQVKKIISESKGLILPTQWYEGFPVSIVEALSMGTPVIGANIGNTGSIIIDGVTGKKFNSKDPYALCKIIEDLDKEYMFNHKLIKEVCINEYGQEHNYETLIGIYKDIMEKNK